MKARYKHEIPLDLYCDPLLLPLEPLGQGPLLPDPVKRQPYDSLYLKLKAQRDYWSAS